MNRTNIDSHFNDTESSVSAVGNDEIVLDNHEEDYDNHEKNVRPDFFDNFPQKQ